MSDSMDKAVYQAAEDGKEAELRRLIERGGSVNWHNPEVRRRMCLAWARSRPLLSPDTAPPRHNPTRCHRQRARRASAVASPPPRRHAELGTRLLDVRGAPHARMLRTCRLVSHVDSGSFLNRSTIAQL